MNDTMTCAGRQSAINILEQKIINLKNLVEKLEKTKFFLQDQGKNIPQEMEEMLWGLFLRIPDRAY